MAASIGRFADRKNMPLSYTRHPGRDPQAPGRRVGRAFLGRLTSGPNPLRVLGGSARRSWADWCLGLFPLRLLGLADWPGVLGLGPRYPQLPPRTRSVPDNDTKILLTHFFYIKYVVALCNDPYQMIQV